mgnify:FL=1|tara:strand:+ start:2269 stop:2454 length:186 start_codon:yes stop_codon:yes gene_type:complete
MKDLITAFGLLLFIEGLVLAMFPSRIKIIIKSIENTPKNKLRLIGTIFFLIGFSIVWYIKS